MPRFYRLLADFITGCNVGQDSSLTTAPVFAILSIGFIIESYWGKKLSPETKDNMNRHFHTMFMKPCKHACFLLLMLFLSSCGQVPPPATETSTIPPFAWTAVALTQTALSIPVVMFTPTLQVTPIPTLPPPPILTPDAIQVERWQEYQRELAKVVLASNSELGHDPVIYNDALCEWDILGQSGQEVYLYVVCAIADGNGDARKPAIIYLEPDGSIQKVKLPEPKATNSSMFNYDPFPKDVQEKFCYYFDPFPSDLPQCPYFSTYPRPRLDVLYAHIEYRKTHPDVPPLLVLLVTPAVTPMP